jgi:hypothetical protein
MNSLPIIAWSPSARCTLARAMMTAHFILASALQSLNRNPLESDQRKRS